MSTHFHMDAVRVQGGVVVRLDEKRASFRTYNTTIQEILWPVIEQMNLSPFAEPFPWFESKSMFDGGSGGNPGPEHCFSPEDVLRDIKWVEAEVAKRPKRYPAVWSFDVPATGDHPASTHPSMPAFLGDRAVRLYGEGKKCWAEETTPGPREGIHHELQGPVVAVRLVPDGPQVQVGIRRAPLSREFPEVMAGLKRVCFYAIQERARILTEYVH